ncbi:LysM peptidoglycan-binding domain-containing protein [Solimonas sp. K1W22B-7]|uniref:PA14 domain-containing protein n=1 Tax=Solimonas sp. K1W22B-7 TaxID=2303331 RepID=UPI000E33534B|nr:PA14 domain-containing protein [Solimonas sp. K1W22B-7]AXQ28041.1 LysM peptidoglycan-binding domain-containing protein [Solimonas sp. K1W22B-7]
MVAIVGGTGLGLFNSSLSQLNGFGSTGKGQIGQGRDQAYVNAATGNLVIQGQDDYLASLGLDLAAMRTYNSLGLMDGGNNDGWTLFGSRRLVAPLPAAGGTASVVRINDDGHQATFVNVGTDLWQSTDGSGAHDTLARQANGTWIYTEGSSRATETYDANGRLVNAKDADGNTQTYGYTGSLLTSVTDASGQVTTLAYDANNNLTSIQTSSNGQQAIRVRYVYETQGSLTRLNSVEVDLGNADDTVRDSDTQIFFTKYEYESSSSNRITGLVQGRKSTVGGALIETARLNVGYVASGTYAGRVQTLTTVTGGTEPNRTLTFSYLSATQTSVTDTLGYVTTYTYDGQSRLTKVEAPLVSGASARSTTQYLYDADGNVSQVITLYENGSNRSTNYTYSGGNLIKIVDQGGNTVERSYDSANQQLTETVYLTPDPDGAGALLASNPVTTRYAYDSEQHLRFEISSEGRVTEYRYNTNGTRAQVRRYSSSSYTATAFAETDLAAWVTALADKTKQELTAYYYDFRGSLASVNRYPTVDAAGNGAGNQATTYFVYGRSGELLETLQLNTSLSSFSDTAGGLIGTLAGYWDYFNGQLRVTNKNDAAVSQPVMSGSTLYAYTSSTTWAFRAEFTTGASSAGREVAIGISNNVASATDPDYRRHLALFEGNQIKVLSTSGGSTQSALLGAAKDNTTYVIEVVTSLVGTDTVSKLYVYERGKSRDEAGVAFQDIRTIANGVAAGWNNFKWHMYTAAGPTKSGATGYIDNLSIHTRQTQINAAQADITSYLYDGLGRVISLTDGAGRTTVTDYQDASNTVVITAQNGLTSSSVFDKAGDLVQTVQSGADIATQTTAYDYDSNGRLRMATDAAGGRTHYLYDERGWKIAEISADNALTEFTYNLAGQPLKTIRYANRVTAALVDGNGEPVAFTLATTGVRVVDTSNDRTTERVYNPTGQLVYLVDGAPTDAERFVTEMVYDGAGRVVATIAYDNVLPASATSWSAIRADRLLVANRDDAANRVGRSFYDKDGLLLGTLDAEGYLVEREYDDAGHLVRQVAYAQQISGVGVTDTRGFADLKILALAAPALVAAKNQTSYLIYDGIGRLIGAIDPQGYFSEYLYDRAGNRNDERRYSKPVVYGAAKTVADYRTEARNQALATPQMEVRFYFTRVVYYYDALNRIVNEYQYYYYINASDADTYTLVTTTVYDYHAKSGQLERTTLAADVTFSASLPERRSTTREYDAAGRVQRELGGVGSYLLLSLPTTATVAEREAIWTQYATTYAYDTAGRRIRATDPNGKTTLYYYDGAGRLRFAVNAAGEVAETTYTAFGEVDKATQHAQRISVSGLTGGADTDSTLAARLAPLDTNNRVTDLDYNKRGLLKKKTDPLAFVIDQTYNSFGQLATRISDVGRTGGNFSRRTDTWSYDHRGQQTGSVVDSTGLAIGETLGYDAFGRVTSKTDGLGRLWKTEYDGLGRVVQTSDPLNQGTVTTYDAFNRVLTQADKLGQVTTYSYDAVGRVITVVTPEGVSTRKTYDRHGVQVKTELLNNAVWETSIYSYDRDGQLIQVNDPNNFIDKTEYDAGGRVAATVDKNGIRTSYTYDDAGRIATRTVDPSSYTPPGSSTPITKANALNLVTSYEYDAFGQSIRTTDASGVVTETLFDKQGQVTAVIADVAGLKLATTYAYVYSAAAVGYKLTVKEGIPASGTSGAWNLTAPPLRTTDRVYDKAGRLITEIVDPAGGALQLTTEYTYDKNNNLVSKKDPNGNIWRYVYDELNRRTHDVDPLGGVTEYRYDEVGRLTETVRRADRVDLAGMPSQVTADMLRYGARLWNSDVSVAGDLGIPSAQTVLAHDYLGQRLVLTTQPGSGAGVVAYGPRVHNLAAQGGVLLRAELLMDSSTPGSYYFGADQQAGGGRTHLAEITNGRIKIYRNDGVTNGRIDMGAAEFGVTYVVEVEVTAGGSQLYIYKKGQPRSSGFNDTLVASWTSVRNRIQVNSAASAADQKAYVDNLSETRMFSDAYAPDRHERNVYDRDGRLAYQIDSQNYVTKTEYDAAGRITRTTRYATAVTLTSSAVVTTPADVAALLQPAPLDSPDQVDSYVFDKAGRLTKATDANTFYTQNGYDSVGRLTSSIDRNGIRTTYAYDAAGRLKTQTVDQGAGTNPITTQPYLNLLTSYEYDVAGNQTKVTDPRGVVTEKIYDAIGRLTTLVVDTADKKSATLYTYDGLGNRKTVAEGIQATGSTGAWNTSAAPLRITLYAYDKAGRLISETVDSGSGTNPATGVAYLNLLTQYGYDKLGNVIRKTDATNKVWNYVYDEVGLKAFDIDPLGAVVEYRYDSWGRLTDTLKYAEYITLPSVLTPDNVRHAAHTTLWYNDLATNTSGLDLLTYGGDAFVHESGRLTLISRSTTAPTRSAFDPTPRAVTAGNKLSIRSSIQIPAGSTGNFMVGAKGGNIHAASFGGGRILAARYTGGGSVQMVDLGAIEAGATYIVEVEVTPTSSTLYIYKSGFARSTGYSNTLAATWTSASLQVDVMSSSSGVDQLAYLDIPGESRVIDDTSALLVRERSAYDKEGRKVFQIDATGAVTQYAYDAGDRVRETRRYANPISPINLASLGTAPTADAVATLVTAANPPATAPSPRVTRYVYDAAGRLGSETIDPSGAAPIKTEYGYDKNGSLASRKDANGNIWRYVYDGGNRRIYEIDPRGGLVEYRYDATGNAVIAMRHAESLDLSGMPEQMTMDLVRYAVATRLWSSALTTGTSGLDITLSQTALVHDAAAGRLVLTTQTVASDTHAMAYGTRDHNLAASGKVVFRGEILMDSTTAGTYYLGAEQTGGTRAHLASFSAGRIKAYRYNGSNSSAVDLGAAEFGVTYVVEVEVTASGSQLNIYKKGQPRTSGWTDALTATWTTARTRVQTTSTSTSAGQRAYVDNLAEYVPSVQNIADRMARKAYDGAGREVYSIDELGYVTESRYRADGLLKETRRYTAPIGLPTPGSLLTMAAVTTALATAQNAAPDVTVYDYDGAGRLNKVTDPNAFITLNSYDKEGRLTSTTDRAGVRTDFTYDANGNQLSRIVDAGSGTSSVTGQAYLNKTTRYEYDAFGNQYREIDSLNVVTERVFDGEGRVLAQIADTAGKKIATVYTYTAYGERRTASEGLLATLTNGSWTYSGVPRYTEYVYDVAGRLGSETVDPLGSLQIKTEYAYDKAGNLVSRKDANLKVWSYVYDEAGRKTHDIDPEGGLTEYRYGSFGQLSETLRYAERSLVPPPTTADAARRAAIAAALLSNNLDSNSNGLSLTNANGVIVRQNGRLELTSSTTAGGAVDGATARSIVGTENLAIRGTMRVLANGTGAFMLGALGNNAHSASFSNGRIFAYRRVGSDPAQFVDLGALEAGATYVVEVEVGVGGSRLYVYKSGEPRSSGYTDDMAANWTSAKLRAETLASSGALGEKAYIDDISETRIVSDLSPLNSRERYAYDQAGRQVYRVDAMGYVTESRYDGAGRVVETQSFSRPVSLDVAGGPLTPASVAAAVTAAHTPAQLQERRVTSQVYDAGGRLAYQIDALNQITEFRYDKEGRMIDTLRYAQPIDITGLPDVMTPDQVRYALVTAIRSSDFASGNGALTLSGTGIVQSAGQMVMTAAAGAAVSSADGPVNNISAADRLIIGGELTVTSPTGTGFFQFGALGNGGRYHLAMVTGNTLSVRTYAGSGSVVETVLGTVELGVAYEVEVDITATASRINIYKKGYPRSSGFSHVFTGTWTTAAARLLLTPVAGSVGERAYFDNMAEYRALADTNVEARRTRMVYDGAGRKVYDIDAVGYVTQTRYDVAGRVSETIRHGTALNHASLAAAPRALDIANLLPSVATGSQDFSVDTAGLTLTPGTGALDLVDGRLRMTVNSSAGTGPTVYGQYTTAPAANTAARIYRAEVQTTTFSASTGFYAGISNDSSVSASRALYARFLNGKVYAVSTGATYEDVELGAVSANTVYVVETAVTATGATIWVYKKGESRSAGYSFTQTANWDKARMGVLSTGTSNPPAAITYIDNLSEGLDVGQRTQYVYDSLGNVISTTDAEGGIERYEYNELGNRTKLINKKGDAWDYGYDAAGRLTREYAPETTVSTRKTDQQGLRVTYYDNSDFTGPAVTADWIGPVDFNWAGSPIAGIGADSFSARMSGEIQVDATGDYTFYAASDVGYRLYIDGKLVVGEWNEQGWALDTAWQTINLSAGRHRIVLEYFDVAGGARLVLSWKGPGMADPLNIPASKFFRSRLEDVSTRVTTQIDYDKLGNVIARTEAFGSAEQRKTEFKYDALGRQIRTVHPNVGVSNTGGGVYGRNETVSALQTQVFHDALGRAVASRDQAGNYSYKVYDLLGRVIREIDEERYVTEYEYDAFGAATRNTRYSRPIDEEIPDVTLTSLRGRELAADPLAADSDAQRNAVLAAQVWAASLALAGGQATGLVATYYSNSDFSGAQYQRIESGLYFGVPDEPISGMGTDGFSAIWEGSWEVTQAGVHEFAITSNDGVRLYIDGVLMLSSAATLSISLATGRHQFRLEFTHQTLNATPSLSVTLKTPGDIARPFTSTFVTGLTPAASRTITTEYDKLGRKTRTVQPQTEYYNVNTDTVARAAPTTEYGYNRFDDLTSQRSSRNGPADWVTTYFGYDKNGNQVHQVDPMGYYTKQDFDAYGRVTRRQEYANALTTVPTSLPDFASFTPPAALDPSANNAKGYDRITRYVYDRLDRQTEQWLVRPRTSIFSTVSAPPDTYADVRQSRVGYDVLGNVVLSTDATGATTTNEYDKLGRLVRTLLPYRSNAALSGVVSFHTPVIEYDYDSLGNRVLETRRANDTGTDSINDQVAEWRHDALGRVIESVDANGFSEYSSYNAYGALTKNWNWQTDVLGGTSFSQRTDASTYDRLGREKATSYQLDGSLRSIKMQYNAFGEMVSKGVEDGYEEYYIYDGAGRVRQSNSEGGAIGVYRYDLLGQVVRTEVPVPGSGTPTQVTEYQRDALGRVTLRTDPSLILDYNAAGATVTPTMAQTFDRWGNALTVTDARSYTTEYRYNHLDKVIYEKLPAVNVILSGTTVTNNYTPETYVYYDPAGRQIAVKDARGNVSATSYDKAGQIVAEYDAYGFAKRHWYDAFGNEIVSQDANGNLLESNYDRLNQVRKLEVKGPSSNPLAVPFYDLYDYDESGNRIKNTNAAGEVTRDRFDARGQIVKHMTPLSYALGDASFSTDYQYDTLGNKTLETDANQNGKAWTYNYFGKVLNHTDLSGGLVTYSYDGQMRLSTQFVTRNQFPTSVSTTISYSYYQNGWLKQIDDTGGGSVERFQYDIAGNRTWEYASTLDPRPSTPTWQTRTTNLQYDSQNRVVYTDANVLLDVNEPQTDLVQNTIYDAVGNRIKIGTTVIKRSYETNSRDNWFVYDNSNRMLLAEGDGSTGVIKVTTNQGTQLAYDAAGNRKTAYQYRGNNKWHYYEYKYDAANRLAETWYGKLNSGAVPASNLTAKADSRQYDGAGRMTRYTEYAVFFETGGMVKVFDGAQPTAEAPLIEYSYRQMSYNANGWQIQQETWKEHQQETYFDPEAWVSHYELIGKTKDSVVAYGANTTGDAYNMALATNANQQGWYDKEGNVLRYETHAPGVTATRYVYDPYLRFDSYKESVIKRWKGTTLKGTITNTYNNDGNLTKLVDDYGATRTYQVLSDGRIVHRKDASDKYQYYFFGNGQLLASGGTLLGPTYEYNYQPISEYYPASAPSQYIATQDGESLESIAAAVWGDASLWYLIADANGLSSSAEVVEGMALEIPNRVTNVHNNDKTFKPYNPGEAIGSLQPTPKPPKKKCGGLLAAIVVIVAVVVSIWCPIALGLVTEGMGFWAAAAAGAVGAAAGSVASQLTAMAVGLQDSFSWSAVGRAAVVGGLTAGLTKGLGGPLLSNVPQGGIGPLSYAGMARGALNSVVGQGVSIALKQQDKFSWSSLAASVVMSGVGGKLNDKLGINSENIPNAFVRDFVGGTVSGLVSRSVQVTLAGKGKIDVLNIAADAFGNVLGNALGEKTQDWRNQAQVDALSADDRAAYDSMAEEGYSHRDAMKFVQGEIVVSTPATEGRAPALEVEVETLGPSAAGASGQNFGPATSSAEKVPQPRAYTVKNGDTLSAVSGFSDPDLLMKLAIANGMDSPHQLRAGKTINLLSAEELAGIEVPDAYREADSSTRVAIAKAWQDAKLAKAAADMRSDPISPIPQSRQDLVAKERLRMGQEHREKVEAEIQEYRGEDADYEYIPASSHAGANRFFGLFAGAEKFVLDGIFTFPYEVPNAATQALLHIGDRHTFNTGIWEDGYSRYGEGAANFVNFVTSSYDEHVAAASNYFEKLDYLWDADPIGWGISAGYSFAGVASAPFGGVAIKRGLVSAGQDGVRLLDGMLSRKTDEIFGGTSFSIDTIGNGPRAALATKMGADPIFSAGAADSFQYQLLKADLHAAELQRPHPLMGTTPPGALGPVTVVAESSVGGRRFTDVNPAARSQPLLEDGQSLVRDLVDTRNPNAYIGDMHAEVGNIHQAARVGVTQGQDMYMTVRTSGTKLPGVCDYCLDSMKQAVTAAELKSLTVYDIDAITSEGFGAVRTWRRMEDGTVRYTEGKLH